jgi:inward rectifier potassium channel
VAISYILLNAVFATAYFFCGAEALNGGGTELGILRTFFFSIQTFATIGYGHISPFGLVTNSIVTFESLFGLLWLALATGLVFARFSRPTAKITFSNVAVIAPYRGITAFEFRIANERKNQIIELEAKVLFSHFAEAGGTRTRRFDLLALERSKVSFFPLNWTVVHPIDETSPLYGRSENELRESEAEFLILLTGIDETFSQTVHARSSYRWDEIVWNAKFEAIYNQPTKNGRLTIDMRRLHVVERL